MQIVDSSIKFSSLLPQRPAPLAFVVSCASNRPIIVRLGVSFCTATRFRLNRLRRLPSSCLNPLGGFQDDQHAFCMQILPGGDERTVYSQVDRLRPRFLDTIFLCTVPQLCTEGFPNRCPSHFTASWWDELGPTFCKIHRLGGDCFVLRSLPTSNYLRTTLFKELELCSETKFVATPGPTRQRRLQSTYKALGCHSLHDRSKSFSAYTVSLQASSYKQNGQLITTHNNRQVQSQVMKCTRTQGCQPAIPNGRCSLQNDPGEYNHHIPQCKRHTNLPHYTAPTLI